MTPLRRPEDRAKYEEAMRKARLPEIEAWRHGFIENAHGGAFVC
jgi:hypothetical protein